MSRGEVCILLADFESPKMWHKMFFYQNYWSISPFEDHHCKKKEKYFHIKHWYFFLLLTSWACWASSGTPSPWARVPCWGSWPALASRTWHSAAARPGSSWTSTLGRRGWSDVSTRAWNKFAKVSIVSYSRPSLMIIASASQFHIYKVRQKYRPKVYGSEGH